MHLYNKEQAIKLSLIHIYNKRDGKGVYKWSNGDVYDGDWKDNRPNGQGTLKTVAGMPVSYTHLRGMENSKSLIILLINKLLYTSMNIKSSARGFFLFYPE